MTNTIQTPQGRVTVRTTAAADGERLKALRLEAVTNHPTSFGGTPADVHARDWTENAAGNDGRGDSAIFVAERAGDLLGMTGIYRDTGVKVRHAAHVWGVYVRPAWRNHGLARSLVTAACDWATSKGVAIVKLTVVPESGALGCYLRCGFRVTGAEPAALAWEGEYFDKVLMSRWLTPDERTRQT